MKKTQKIRRSILLSFLIVLIIVASFQPEINAQQGKKAESLKVALLPILDAFPFYVAASEGYFIDYGVAVKAVPVASGLERDQLMQSGAIDGMLNEMITTANFNRNRLQVKSVISARKAYPDYPLFRVLSAPGSSLTSAGGLAGFASAWVLLPLASLPLAFLQIRLIRQLSDGPALNDLLAQTARLSFFFSVLLAVGLVLS
jgi:NitT/TauT family transport system substrate-binding protein